MKVTVQFENDGNLPMTDVDIEIPNEVMKQFEQVAKDHDTSVDSVISFYIQGILRQMEAEAMEEQDAISTSDS